MNMIHSIYSLKSITRTLVGQTGRTTVLDTHPTGWQANEGVRFCLRFM